MHGRDSYRLESTFAHSKTALVVHGLHKSASMFLYRFFDETCRQISVPYYSINHDPPNRDAIGSDATDSFVLGPERNFSIDRFTFPNMQRTARLFHIRDPRDILISEFHSIGWLHTIKDWTTEELARRKRMQELTVDEYVIQEPEISKYPLVQRFAPLIELLESGRGTANDVTLVKYETMVPEFGNWLREVCPLIGISKESDREFLCQKYRAEFEPDSPTSHKRNVTPGEHGRALKPETIEVLNDRFGKILNRLEYEH